MKRVLIVKTSSMGDVIHTLPALTDAKKAYPDIQFDWVIEPAFAEIPKWHPAVGTIISAPLRRWRKSPWAALKQKEYAAFFHQLREKQYDAVIDAQGLIKSAWMARLARGKSYGYHPSCSRGSIIGYAYHQAIKVQPNLHAVEKIRELFSQILHYPLPTSFPDYGLTQVKKTNDNKQIIFLHGTTWTTKHWPESYWQELAKIASSAGYQVFLPWGSESEKKRAEGIQAFCKNQGTRLLLPQVLPPLTLGEIIQLIATSTGCVAVDTGLAHIAAAMGVPTISLYGPTDPRLTGAYGPSQIHLHVDAPCAPCFSRKCKQGQHVDINPPCFKTLLPEKVWAECEKHFKILPLEKVWVECE